MPWETKVVLGHSPGLVGIVDQGQKMFTKYYWKKLSRYLSSLLEEPLEALRSALCLPFTLLLAIFFRCFW
jgi:hypothetical protein